ncbi:MAG: putative oligopeptide transporter substrate binding protein [Candidatus Peribacteria bacterium]|nr:putative oligopeptide transporter substrate binding protein [Candidatus Peribacteria bacterium]
MDVSFKKVLAGASAVAISLSSIGSVFAAYSDVPSGVWYAEAVQSFTDAGYLDANQTRFRGNETANRAEFVKLIVELNGGILSTPPAAATFDDVKASAWYYGYMEEAAKEKWVMGDNNCVGSHPCYARPAANINRAEAAALIVRAFALTATGDAPQFVDNPSGQWYTDAIQTAADACVLQGDGSTGRVRPSDNMNRAEMVVMLHRVDQGLTYGVDCQSGSTVPEKAGVSSATATSTTTVEVLFNAALDQTSAEDIANFTVKTDGGVAVAVTAAKLVEPKVVQLTVKTDLTPDTSYTVSVSNVLSAKGDTISGSATFKGFSDVAPSNGSLELAVASTNPVSDTVPKAANGVTMMSMDVTASKEEDVTIDNLTVLHEGFGDSGDISGIYASVDGARLSRKRSIDSDNQTADLRFRTPLVIKKGTTVTLDIVADFNSTAVTSSEHNLVVELPSDVSSNAKQVTGNFPLRGNTFKIAAITSGTITVTYRSVNPSQVSVGEKDRVLGRFEASANSIEDQTIYSMTVRQNGSTSDGDVGSLKIRRSDGTVVSNIVPAFVSDSATFVFDPPLTVKQGDKLTFDIVGDILGGAGKTAKLDFEETGDIFAVGSLYGYGVNGQLYGSQVSLSGTVSTVTIKAGEFTIGINGPVQSSYTRDARDVVLANVSFTSGKGDDVDIKKLFFAIEGETSTGAALSANNTSSYDNIHEVLDNVGIRNTKTGKSISATRLTDNGTYGQTAGVGTYQIYRIDDLIVKATDNNYAIRANFINNGAGNSPKGGDQFKVHICGEAQNSTTTAGVLQTNSNMCTFGGLITASSAYQMEIEGLSTGDPIGDVRPGGNISGNFQRIASATLTVAVKSTASTDTAVKNSKNVTLMRFEGRAGEAKDVLFTHASFKSASGSLNNGTNYALWADTDGDSKVDTVLESGQSPQGGVVSFSDIKNGGFVIPKEQTVLFEVHSDIASTITGDDLSIGFNVGTPSTTDSYIEAQELDTGSSLSGIKTNTQGCTSNCDITVTTVATENYLLVSQGDLFVSLDTTPLRNRQCLGGALCDEVLRLNFHAENEDIDVTDLQINSSGSTATSVDRLELYKVGAATPFATATVGACGNDDTVHSGNATVQTFCAQMESRQLIVPKGQDLDVLVRPRLKTDVEGAVQETLQFFISKETASSNNTGTGSIRGRGDQSSNNLTGNNGDATAAGEVFIGATSAGVNTKIAGNLNKTVLSKITSITNASPDANGTDVSSGTSDIARYKIAAAPNSNSKNGLNKVTLSGVIFNVNATNVTLSSFKFYNKATSSFKRDCTAVNAAGTTIVTASGSFLVRCDSFLVTTLAADQKVSTGIDQGTDAQFALEANIGATSTTSAVNVELKNFDSSANTTFGPGTTQSHFVWVDQDNASATTASFLWVEYPETTVKSTNYSNN